MTFRKSPRHPPKLVTYLIFRIHMDFSAPPSRTRTDTVRILSPCKWIHLNVSGLDICLFATLFVHHRPAQSMKNRTDLRHSRDTELPPILRHRTVLIGVGRPRYRTERVLAIDGPCGLVTTRLIHREPISPSDKCCSGPGARDPATTLHPPTSMSNGPVSSPNCAAGTSLHGPSWICGAG